MGLKMMRAGDAVTPIPGGPVAIPMAVCDVCEGAISDASIARYAWDRRTVEVTGVTADFWIVHKGECLETVRATGGDDAYRDSEFARLLAYLISNSNADVNMIDDILAEELGFE